MKFEVITTIASALFFLSSMTLALHLHLSSHRLNNALPESTENDSARRIG